MKKKGALRGIPPLERVAKNRRFVARERLFPSVSFPLALRFMLLIAAAMLSLSLIFVFALRQSVTRRQTSELEKCISLIEDSIQKTGSEELSFLPLPYYITYTVYDSQSRTVISTNDSLLPLLDSQGKSRTYFEKDFFTDSDLNIRYLTKNIFFDDKKLVIQCAFDIANDSATKMLSELPLLALFSLIPLLILSFALSFLISKSTIVAFKKLRDDYDREKAFTSNVSHELKTPISIIDGHANLLKRWGKDDPKQLAESIDTILHETENMNSIVTTLLDMSRIENGKIKIEKTRFFVTNFFVSLKEEFTTVYPEMSFEIIDEDFLEIESDEQKLHQIFTVILSNSMKFAGRDCKIRLKANKNGGKIELSASDNGKGFSEQVLPHVFERFYKGDSSHDRNVSGAGLGLSIAKTLALALGAQITAGNNGYGGAEVRITLGT